MSNAVLTKGSTSPPCSAQCHRHTEFNKTNLTSAKTTRNGTDQKVRVLTMLHNYMYTQNRNNMRTNSNN
eukprot:2408040-Amphidinium_carterae.1